MEKVRATGRILHAIALASHCQATTLSMLHTAFVYANISLDGALMHIYMWCGTDNTWHVDDLIKPLLSFHLLLHAMPLCSCGMQLVGEGWYVPDLSPISCWNVPEAKKPSTKTSCGCMGMAWLLFICLFRFVSKMPHDYNKELKTTNRPSLSPIKSTQPWARSYKREISSMVTFVQGRWHLHSRFHNKDMT